MNICDTCEYNNKGYCEFYDTNHITMKEMEYCSAHKMRNKKLKAVIATTKIDKQKQQFTKKALEKMASNMRSKDALMVLYNFNFHEPIGYITNLEMEEENLVATILISNKGNLDFKNKVFRVQGILKRSHKEGDIEVLDEFEILGIGLIDKIMDVYEED